MINLFIDLSEKGSMQGVLVNPLNIDYVKQKKAKNQSNTVFNSGCEIYFSGSKDPLIVHQNINEIRDRSVTVLMRNGLKPLRNLFNEIFRGQTVQDL